MATLDDSVLERLRELNGLRDRALDFRERGRKALAKIPSTVDIKKLTAHHDLSSDQWVSGRHPVDLALVVRLLNNQGLRGQEFEPCCDSFHNVLKDVIETRFARDSCLDRGETTKEGDRQNRQDPGPKGESKVEGDTAKDTDADPVPVLTAARAMHALVGKSETVFSTATMLCYYQIVRELYLATFPNWIIGAARAGEGGRVSAFVTGECVRAVLAFQNSIRHTITFFTTTKKLFEELERLKAIPPIDDHLTLTEGASHWQQCFEIEVERIVLDWYAANNLRRNVIALNLWLDPKKDGQKDDNMKPKSDAGKIGLDGKAGSTCDGDGKGSTNEICSSVFELDGGRIQLESIRTMLKNLPISLQRATDQAMKDIGEARQNILAFRESEAGRLSVSAVKNLAFVAEMLVENPNKEYQYYLKALSTQTRKDLREYHKSRRLTKRKVKKSPQRRRVQEDELKAALVKEFNNNFAGHLVARASDWEELVRRTDDRMERKFSKETEWLVEKHLGVIKLVKSKKKWEGTSELIQLNRMFLEEAFCKKPNDPTTSAFKRVDRRRFDATSGAHAIALRVVGEALDEAQRAATALAQGNVVSPNALPALLDRFHKQYVDIYKRIGRVIEPAKRYIQDVLNRELAHAANSAKFDAGELLFAAASYGAITKWKRNEQLLEARKLSIDLLPEDGKFQTSRPIQSTSQGLQLIPIEFEVTRCFAQLLRKDFGEDLDPNIVRKLLNLFEENPIEIAPGIDERVGWNFSGAPESQKPSVWVTAVGVFALDRTIRMLNERINAIVLRHFNVALPKADTDPWADVASGMKAKMDLGTLMNIDYELQSAFRRSDKLKREYDKTPHRMDNVSLPIRLQQMRAHLTRAVLPTYYSKNKDVPAYSTAYNGIFYGPPGTGKTTFAEALATSARVPLVRLSPSDLMVQGTDVIESRARAIFDSLSMLTRAVIFLDEFEPVVRTRSEPDDRPAGAPSKGTALPPDPPEFRFLVTGMLPKLTKLNEVAAVQSVVYLLATNYLVQIDDAAKRKKRFDLHLPIYHPDPMSRLLALWYRLLDVLREDALKWRDGLTFTESPQFWTRLEGILMQEGTTNWKERLPKFENNPTFWIRVKEVLNDEAEGRWRDQLLKLQNDPKFWERVKTAIAITKEVSAQSLATVFFSLKSSQNFVTYVRYGNSSNRPGEPTSDQATIGDKTTPVETDIQSQRQKYEESWGARKIRRPSPVRRQSRSRRERSKK
jgi:SpoVK/Ycf46/Vps4 family AAA+-type ATPase